MATVRVAAPPSPQVARQQQVARARVLKAKGAGRSAAEVRELLDLALALLPPGVLG